VKDYLTSQATDVVGDSPQEFAAYLNGEIARWAKVVKASGATAE
jgi:tripartite-type tricarboxylate transporter receptor subunit TctC